MKRLVALGIVLCLLAGCGGAKPVPAATDPAPAATQPAPAATEPAPGTTPAPATTPSTPAPSAAAAPAPATPAPDPVAALQQFCNPPGKGPSTAAFSPLLLGVLKNVPPDQVQKTLDDITKTTGMCFSYSTSKPGDPALVVAGSLDARGAAVLWRDGEHWAGQDVPDLGEMENILLQRQDPKGREVYLRSGNMGTGVFGAFVALRQEGGTWKKLFASPVFEKMGVKALSDMWVLVTSRNLPNDIPLINSANCCMPIDYQWLYKREGDSFKLAAERQAPDPAFTINVFMGAVRDNNSTWITRLGSAQAAEAARKLNLAQLQVGWGNDPEPKQGDPDLRSIEFAHWDALPPEFNGPAPTQTTLAFKAKVPNSTSMAIMTMKRQGDLWFIDSITEQRP